LQSVQGFYSTGVQEKLRGGYAINEALGKHRVVDVAMAWATVGWVSVLA